MMNSGMPRPSHQWTSVLLKNPIGVLLKSRRTLPKAALSTKRGQAGGGFGTHPNSLRSATIWAVILGLLFLATPAFTQRLYLPQYVEPKPFDFNLTQISSGVYAEGVHDKTTYKN